MADTNNYDVAIIGNGSIGMSLAFRLKRLDKKLAVAVIGPPSRPGSASLAAGAMVNVWAELAKDQFENPALADRAQLPIDSMPLWDGWCDELREFAKDTPKIAWGTYVINNALGSPHETATVDYILKTVRERGVKHELVNPGDVPWLKPEARAQISRVLWVPDGRFHSARMLAAYEGAARAAGVKFVQASATGLKVGQKKGLVFGGKESHITLDDGATIRAKNLVLANGAYAQALVDQNPELRKGVPRLVWGAGSALEVTLPDWVKKYGGLDRSILDIDQVVRTVDRGGACGIHIVPYGDGEYYLGASSGVWFDPEHKARVHALHTLLKSLVEEIHFGFFFAGATIRGPGFRPVSADTFPLLGESHIPGVWYANGTKRDGFTCSPFIANELAKAILGQPHKLPKRFQPSRKLISFKNRQQAIEDSASADIGGEVQHGLAMPPYAHGPYRIAKMKAVERIYDKRKITDFGIHPEITHLYDNDDFFAAIDHPRESVPA